MKILKPIDTTDHYLGKMDEDQDKYMPLILDLCTKMAPFEREDTFKKIKSKRGYSMQTIRNEFNMHKSSRGAETGSYIEIVGKKYKIPPGYIVDDSGVTFLGDKGLEKITIQKIIIDEIGFDQKKKFFYLQIYFEKNGKAKTVKVQKSDVYDKQKIIRLSNLGMDVHSGNSQALVIYLVAFFNENEDVIEKINVVSQFGWSGNVYNTPLMAIYKDKTEEPWFIENEIKRAGYKKNGSLEKWILTVKSLHKLTDPSLMVFLLYAGFGAAIWEKLKRRTMVIHMYGATSGGKSISICLPASIYGNPNTNNGIIQRWSSTRVSHGRFLVALKNIPYFLDELSVNAKSNFESLIYEFEGEISKGKAALDDPLKTVPQFNWSTIIFSTGEITLIHDATQGGATVRAFEFDGSPFREINRAFVSKFKEDLLENNGLAIEPYIKAYFDFDWKSIEPFYSDKDLNNEESRIMDQFQGFYIAGILAEQVFDFGFDPKTIVTSIFEEILKKRREEGDFIRNFLNYLADYFDHHRNNFFNVDEVVGSIKTINDTNYGTCYGYVFKENSSYDLAVSKTIFNTIVSKWGNKNSSRSILKELSKRKYIKSEKGSYRIRKKIDGEQKSLVYFPNFEQHLSL